LFTVFTKQGTHMRRSTVLSLPLQFRCSNTQYTLTLLTQTHTHSHTHTHSLSHTLTDIQMHAYTIEKCLSKWFPSTKCLSKICYVESLSCRNYVLSKKCLLIKCHGTPCLKFVIIKGSFPGLIKNGLILLSGEISNLSLGGN
jgi:hypothetical protein